MPFNLLLLPLLGGFVFTRNWVHSRYYALRSDGHVLLFYAATAGAVFLLIAAFITCLLGPICTGIDHNWHVMSPFEHSGKAMLAFFLGATIWYPLNWFADDETAIDRVILRRQDSLELLLRTAMGEGKLVSLSVKNGKVYVGYVISTINPAFPMETLSLIPMMSGYRDEDTKKLVLTTQYTDAFAQIEQEIERRVIEEARTYQVTGKELENWIQDETDTELENFKIVIPVQEIQSANIFKIDTYNRYFREQADLSTSLTSKAV